MKNNKTTIIIASIILIVFLLLLIIVISSNSKTEQIPAIVNSKNTELSIKGSKEKIALSKGTKVSIIKENSDNYLIESDNKQGLVEKDKITYFTFNSEEKYSLVLDVSKFNIENKNLKDFVEFAKFIVDNKINYTYIRLCRQRLGLKRKYVRR